MKKVASILLSAALASVAFIGCDFVDGNSTHAEIEEPAHIEARFDGYFTAGVDTTGNEDPDDMPPTGPIP